MNPELGKRKNVTCAASKPAAGSFALERKIPPVMWKYRVSPEEEQNFLNGGPRPTGNWVSGEWQDAADGCMKWADLADPRTTIEPDWKTCREQFQTVFTDKEYGFYFAHNSYPQSDVRANIAKFIWKVEDIIRIKELRSDWLFPYDYINICPTQYNFISWIEPSVFWLECPARRSLLTILLRCGQEYNPATENFDTALFNNGYVKETKDAVMRFLLGFTCFVPDFPDTKTKKYSFPGWVNAFKGKPRTYIKAHLVSPDVPANSVDGSTLL